MLAEQEKGCGCTAKCRQSASALRPDGGLSKHSFSGESCRLLALLPLCGACAPREVPAVALSTHFHSGPLVLLAATQGVLWFHIEWAKYISSGCGGLALEAV